MIPVDLQKTINSLVAFGRASERAEGATKLKQPLLQLASSGGKGHFLRLIRLGEYRFTPLCWIGGLDLRYIRAITQHALDTLGNEVLLKYSVGGVPKAVDFLNKKIVSFNLRHPGEVQIVPLDFSFGKMVGGVPVDNLCLPRRGIANSGNSCYLNALFVALCTSVGLRKELIGCKPPNEINQNLRRLFYALTTRERRDLSPSIPPLSELLSGLGEAYSSSKSVSGLFKSARWLPWFSQQDAQETSLFLLSAALGRSDLIHFREIVEKKALPGLFIPSVDCKSVEYKEPVTEEANMLPVGLRVDKSFSLQKNFTGVMGKEEIEVDHILHRDENKNLNQAQVKELLSFEGDLPVVRRQILCGTAPSWLPIHLHRFKTVTVRDDEGEATSVYQKKLFTQVEIPFRLKVPVLNSDTVEYVLRSVIVHSGCHGRRGHYLTYVPYQTSKDKNSDEMPARWIVYNDDKVSVSSWEDAQQAVERQGYILLYDRCDILYGEGH